MANDNVDGRNAQWTGVFKSGSHVVMTRMSGLSSEIWRGRDDGEFMAGRLQVACQFTHFFIWARGANLTSEQKHMSNIHSSMLPGLRHIIYTPSPSRLA